MKQQLWIANSSLLGIFFLALAMVFLLEQKPPTLRIRQDWGELEKKKSNRAPVNKEAIFTDDIFGTFVPVERKATKQNFVAPIPEPQTPAFTPAPEPPVLDFLPAVTITLKGLILSSDEAKSVAMIADETGKEGMYHLGEKIKDGYIVKIAHNRIVLLRVNGQQEVFYLRSDDSGIDVSSAKWSNIIKKIDDTNIEIDPQKFTKMIGSLGAFLDLIPIVGTAYKKGSPIGIRVSPGTPDHIASFLGLLAQDLITTIDGIDVIDTKKRVSAYESVIKKKIGDVVEVVVSRASQPLTIKYKLVAMKAPSADTAQKPVTPVPGQPAVAPPSVPGQPAAPVQPAEAEQKMGRLQQREQRIREFSQRHDNSENKQEAIREIRKRLLDNLRNRLHTSRTR